MKSPIGVALVLVAVCALSSHGQQPEPPPVFRLEVDAVEIDALVTDAQGNPVADLTADDFEVLENGRAQTITSFTHVNIPIERAERPLYAPAAIEPDVQRNDGAEGRLYVIAFGDVDTTLVLRTRNFLRRFIEDRFGENDRAAVVSLGRTRRADAQDFTNNRRLLLNAIGRFTGDFVDPPDDAATPSSFDDDFLKFLEEAGASMPPSLADDMAIEAIVRASSTMTALRQLAEFMGTIGSRRKTLILISTGIPVNMFSVVDNSGAVMSLAAEQAREAARAAMLGNVTIYTLNARGLTTAGGFATRAYAPTRGQVQAQLQREVDEGESLRALADVTGGFSLNNSNNFDGAFERIVRENSAYYVLGYQSTNERRDGRYRRIRVRVNRPGVQVRTRDGYLAPTDQSRRPQRPRLVADVNPAVGDALASPIGVAALPMRIFTAPYKGEGPNAAVAVAVEIGPAGIELPERDGAFTGQLEVVHAVTAANGRLIPGDRHRLDLALRPETYEQVRQNGFRVLLQPQLPPGRYQVRVAAGFSGGRTGSVVADLEVPDFSRQPLMMAGVSLTSAAAEGALTMRVAEPLAGSMPGPLTAAREFAAGDTVTIYTEVYENLRNPVVHTVHWKAELRTDEGRVVSTSAEERSSNELGGRSGGYGFLAEIPLRDFEPGLYVVHVEARANIGDRTTVSRDIQIRVR